VCFFEKIPTEEQKRLGATHIAIYGATEQNRLGATHIAIYGATHIAIYKGDVKIFNFPISLRDGLVIDVSFVCEFMGSSRAPGGWKNGVRHTNDVIQARANIKNNKYAQVYGLVHKAGLWPCSQIQGRLGARSTQGHTFQSTIHSPAWMDLVHKSRGRGLVSKKGLHDLHWDLLSMMISQVEPTLKPHDTYLPPLNSHRVQDAPLNNLDEVHNWMRFHRPAATDDRECGNLEFWCTLNTPSPERMRYLLDLCKNKKTAHL